MIGAFLANVLALLISSPSNTNGSFIRLGRPFAAIFLALQLIFYGLAWLGNQISLEGKIGKLLYLPTFLVNSNRAALIGLYRMVTKRQSTLWQRAQRREEVMQKEDEPT
jgi:hypothetical protein